MANQVLFLSEQVAALAAALQAVEAIPDTTPGKSKPVYDLVNPWIQSSDADARTKLFFRLAVEVNENAFTPANIYIREVTIRGLGLPPVGDASADNIQRTSSVIARAIFEQMRDDEGVPQLDDIIRNDVANAITTGGQTWGGWGGSLFFLDAKAGPDRQSVAKMIFADGLETNKFEQATIGASMATIGQFGITNDFNDAIGVASGSVYATVLGAGSDLDITEKVVAARTLAKIGFEVSLF